MATTINNVPSSVDALRQVESYYAQALEAVREAILRVQRFEVPTNPRKYSGKRLAVALEEYLFEVGGKASRADCLAALQSGGAELGERPIANLSTTITRNSDRFRVREDSVMLVEREQRAA